MAIGRRHLQHCLINEGTSRYGKGRSGRYILYMPDPVAGRTAKAILGNDIVPGASDVRVG